MESSLVSWQYENFSSAELVSPPVSPNPPSPSLYNGGQEEKGQRARTASILLNQLEQERVANDFGLNWNEESVNLNDLQLFEELQEIEYTPPASPKKSLASESSVLTSAEKTQVVLNNVQFSDSADISILTAEFQAILDSLPKDEDNTDALSQVLQIAGIPTTVVNGEAVVPVELDLSMELDEINNMDIIADADVIEESELYGMSDLSSHGSPASSVHSHSQYQLDEIEVDEHSRAAQNILDALIQGNVAAAESFLPRIVEEPATSSSSYVEEIVEAVEKKPERRGRKPAKKTAKALIKDKAQRKKEQNKSAATRYRQKKKMEFAIVVETEAELQEKHDALEQKKEDLAKQILMVKQLLRDVLQAKKPAMPAKPIVIGSVPLPTTIGRNRRK